MAVTTSVLSGNITDLTGDLNAAYLKRVVIVVEANTPGSMLLDTDGNRILAGAKRVDIDTTTGAYTVTLPRTDSADILPSGARLYKVTLIYPNGTPGAGNVTQQSGWWELEADGSLSDADRWPGLEVTVVSSAVLDSIGDSVTAAQLAETNAETAAAAAADSAADAALLGGGWAPEILLVEGRAAVATNAIPPGIRVPVACELTDVFGRAGTAPTGASLIINVKRSGSTIANITFAAASTTDSDTGLSVALTAGDILTFDVTQVGSTLPGSDIALQLVCS